MGGDARSLGQVTQKTVKQPLAAPKISFPTNAVYMSITYSQGKEHSRWGYLSFYSANKPFPLHSTARAHRPCLFICPCAGTELVKTAGNSPEKRQEQEVCPWENIATQSIFTLIHRTSWIPGLGQPHGQNIALQYCVMGEEQSGTQVTERLAWVLPGKSKGTQERAVRRGDVTRLPHLRS